MQCTITRNERNVTNILFLAEGPRIENFAVIAGTIVGVPALLIAIWWCVRYLVGSSYIGGGQFHVQVNQHVVFRNWLNWGKCGII